MLAPRDYRAASRFLMNLYACRDPDGLARLVAREMLPLVGGEQSAWNELAFSLSWVRVIAYPPLQDVDWVNRTLAAYMHEHPVINAWRRDGDTRVHAISDHLSVPAYHRTGIYQGFYRAFGHEDQISQALTPPHGHALALAFNRGRRGFSGRDREMLRFLSPAVRQAWHNAEALARAERTLAGYREVAALSQCVIELDRDGRPLDCPERAVRWLRQYFADAPLRGTAGLPDTLTAWVRQCARHSGEGVRLSPLVRRRGTRRLLLRYFPLAGDRALLALEERSGATGGGHLRRAGLTRREVEVLREMEAGKTNAEAAADLCVSPATVKKHLDNIYRKLEVKNRTAAVARLRRAE